MDNVDPVVFVVDSDKELVSRIVELLGTVGLETRVFDNGKDFLAAYDPGQPGCLVLDVRMPGMSGLELQARLVEDGVSLPVVFLTAYGDVPMVVQAMKRGAAGFMEKPFRNQELVDTIHEALTMDAKNRKQKEQRRRLDEKVALLSKRERQVMDVLLTGRTTKVVARDLGISRKTVDYHRGRIMQKMKVDTLLEISRMVLDSASGPG